jgi:hypothetical protein
VSPLAVSAAAFPIILASKPVGYLKAARSRQQSEGSPNQGSWCRDRMCHQKQVVTREFHGMITGHFVSFVLCHVFLQRRSISTGTFLEDWDESWTWTWI